MTIETQFNLGQTVFFMHENAVQEGTIKLIQTKNFIEELLGESIEYKVGFTDRRGGQHELIFREEQAHYVTPTFFASKKDLLESL